MRARAGVVLDEPVAAGDDSAAGVARMVLAGTDVGERRHGFD